MEVKRQAKRRIMASEYTASERRMRRTASLKGTEPALGTSPPRSRVARASGVRKPTATVSATAARQTTPAARNVPRKPSASPDSTVVDGYPLLYETTDLRASL